eukprot:TRINITY_DN9370_c0_g2_i1.p1 TRINITY_DN9370_c0_g2~~TRINITY_DN9370_c0_g2_i1.p1  ORF type:complete len:401 (+),score=28.05 TRINITY_DN9370_c0_g2_i1:239-1441(+)
MSASTSTANSAPFFKSNPSNPSSTNLPQLAGRRLHLPHLPANAKKFKPNLGCCRTRPLPESAKEDLNPALHEFAPWHPDACHHAHPGGGQSEGSGVIEEGDPEEGAPFGVSTNSKKSFEKYFEASSNASTLASPVTCSFEPTEVVTEFDLTQDAFEDPGAVRLSETEVKKLLEKLKQEKGLMCIEVNQILGEMTLSFRCPAGHVFSTKISNKITCRRCEAIMEKCSQHAKQHNGKLFLNFARKTAHRKVRGVRGICVCKGTHMESQVQRMVKIVISCRVLGRWCEDCGRQRKRERKKRRRQEEQRRYYEKFAQEQNELLETARLHMLQQTSSNPFLTQIDQLAKQMASSYLYSRSEESLKASFEDATLVYKVLATPQEFLVQTHVPVSYTHLTLPTNREV